MEQGSIFPEIKVVRAPRVVQAVCECLGGVASVLGNLPATPLAPHGDHVPSWVPEADPRPKANEQIN